VLLGISFLVNNPRRKIFLNILAGMISKLEEINITFTNFPHSLLALPH
jgi:hypothetical protein